jgi:hypothetical protein
MKEANMAKPPYDLSDEELSQILDGTVDAILDRKIQASAELQQFSKQVRQLEEQIKKSLIPPTPQQIANYVSGNLAPEEKDLIEFFMETDPEIRAEVGMMTEFLSDNLLPIGTSFRIPAVPEHYVVASIQHEPIPLSERGDLHGLRSTPYDKYIRALSDPLDIAITMQASESSIVISGSIMSHDETESTEGIVELWTEDRMLAVVRTYSSTFACQVAQVPYLEARLVIGQSHRITVSLLDNKG